MANDVVALRLVGDTKAKPGAAAVEGDASVKPVALVLDKQTVEFTTQHYDSVPAPPAAKAMRLHVDLSLYSGQDNDRFFIMYGFDYSLDAGKTWLFGRRTTAGNNPVPQGFDPISWSQSILPLDEGNGILILPMVGCKAALDVGVKIEWL